MVFLLRFQRLAPQQRNEIFHRESSVRNDAAERIRPDSFVVRNHSPRVRLVAAEHHVAAGLPAKNKAGTLESAANFTTR